MLSLRSTLLELFGPQELAQGVRGLRNPFYPEAKKQTGIDVFPYQGLRALIRSIPWPRYVGAPDWPCGYDYPQATHPGFGNNAQGVANDDEHWYFSRAEKWTCGNAQIWKVPLSTDLKRFPQPPQPYYKWVSVPDDILARFGESKSDYHFGALDHYRGLLFIALEKHGTNLSAIAVFDTELSYKGVWNFPDRNDSPWCAINPRNGLLYTSNSRIDADNPLFVYRPTIVANHVGGIQGVEDIAPVGRFPLRKEDGSPIVIAKVAGGAFSSLGHLYLVSDGNDAPPPGPREYGIMGFDMYSGRRRMFLPIHYRPDDDEELEGIAVADFGAYGAASGPPAQFQSPNIPGQLHVIMVNVGATGDDFYLKHFWLANRAEDIAKI